MEKVVIIGTGCAGFTAALYTARANLSPLVLAGAMPGGLLTTTSIVENYPGFPDGVDGTELMMKMQKQCERFGARVQYEAVEKADLSKQPFQSRQPFAQPLRPLHGAGLHKTHHRRSALGNHDAAVGSRLFHPAFRVAVQLFDGDLFHEFTLPLPCRSINTQLSARNQKLCATGSRRREEADFCAGE